MDMNFIMELITQGLFPIGMCMYLLWQNDKLRSVLEKNTVVLQKLLTKLGLDENGDGEVDQNNNK